MTDSFSSADARRIAAKRLPLLPGRVGTSTRGAAASDASRQAGDLFWKCAVECFKPVYTRIDQRYSLMDRAREPKIQEKHANLISEAKKILQEHRNLVFESVLPMFFVGFAKANAEPNEAYQHAEDYFCRNVFPVMIDTLVASLPSFVEKDDVETLGQHVRNLAEVQLARLKSQMLNFSFAFRPIVTPEEAQKRK